MKNHRLASRPITLAAGRALREIALVGAGLLVYFLIRGNVTDRAADAQDNAASLIALEQRLHLFHEPAMQAWVLDNLAQVRLWNWVYFWLHAPVIVVMGLWLLWRRTEVYRLIRNAFLVSAVIALICYSLYPVAPPRLVSGYGFVDTMARYSRESYQAESLKPFVNPYAAVPSLHFGWSYLIGVALFLVWRDWRGLGLGLLLSVLMALAIVLTANHYVLDAVAGFLVASVGLAAALWWERGRPLPGRRSLARRRSKAGAPSSA